MCDNLFTLCSHSREALESGEDVATCPSCSLIVRVIYDMEQFCKLETIQSTPVNAVEVGT